MQGADDAALLELGQPFLDHADGLGVAEVLDLVQQLGPIRKRAGGDRPATSRSESERTSGVPVHIVAARLGDDPTTVLSTYAHLLPQSDELAAERVAALIA